MAQSRFAIRIGLVALACVIVLGVGAVFFNRGLVDRALTTNSSEVVATAPVATPKVDEPSTSSTPAAAASAAETQSREASWREAREAAIRVQQRLRAQQQARKSAQQEEAKNERCVDGLRMKRIENGWVQAGNC